MRIKSRAGHIAQLWAADGEEHAIVIGDSTSSDDRRLKDGSQGLARMRSMLKDGELDSSACITESSDHFDMDISVSLRKISSMPSVVLFLDLCSRGEMQVETHTIHGQSDV